VEEIGYDDPTTGFDYRSCAVLRSLPVTFSRYLTRGGHAAARGAGGSLAGTVISAWIRALPLLPRMLRKRRAMGIPAAVLRQVVADVMSRWGY